MVIIMSVKNYLMINESNGVVDNVCLWDGDLNTWQPPAGYLMLIQETTMARIWEWDSELSDWALAQEVGQGQIGFVWDGVECVTNEPKPKPPKPQPVTQGTQTI